MDEREQKFWQSYHEIEKVVPYSESKFIESRDVFDHTMANINRCLEVVIETARELAKSAGIESDQSFKGLMWSLGRAGVLKPVLLEDALDVYSILEKRDFTQAGRSTIYASLVRIMEVFEAIWKDMERTLRSSTKTN